MHTRLDSDEILQRIREAVAQGRTRKRSRTFRPPTARDFRSGTQILAFDQTLSNCGWALINTEEGLSVVASSTIRPPHLGSVKGFEATFAKAVVLAREIADTLATLGGQFEYAVLELPSVVGYRTESSLAAALTICVEMDRQGLGMPQMVSRQAAGALLVGDRHASKAESSAFVNDLLPDHPVGTGCWTEHVRDACFVGLETLYEEEQ